jgi:hypothetical protein
MKSESPDQKLLSAAARARDVAHALAADLDDLRTGSKMRGSKLDAADRERGEELLLEAQSAAERFASLWSGGRGGGGGEATAHASTRPHA